MRAGDGGVGGLLQLRRAIDIGKVLARGQLYLGEQAQSVGPCREPPGKFLGDLPRLVPVAFAVQRFGIGEDHFRIARRHRDRCAEELRRLRIALFQRAARQAVRSDSVIRFALQRLLEPLPRRQQIATAALRGSARRGIAHIRGQRRFQPFQHLQGAPVVARGVERNCVIELKFAAGWLECAGLRKTLRRLDLASRAELERAEPVGEVGVFRIFGPTVGKQGERFVHLAAGSQPVGLVEIAARIAGAHWSRSHPTSAVRPTGAKGGT